MCIHTHIVIIIIIIIMSMIMIMMMMIIIIVIIVIIIIMIAQTNKQTDCNRRQPGILDGTAPGQTLGISYAFSCALPPSPCSI